uniref:DUF148 domain-containing protein n=1 Tax=Steinernema glaseri TaxID=37863 RepID=A0A1I7YMR5_9BILA
MAPSFFLLLLLCTASCRALPGLPLTGIFQPIDEIEFYEKLSDREKGQFNETAERFVSQVEAGLTADFHEFVLLAKTKYAALYEKLLLLEGQLKTHVDALPASVQKFVHVRREEVTRWFEFGTLNTTAVARTMELTARDIAAMDMEERGFAFGFFPSMQIILENWDFKASVAPHDYT